MLEVKNAVKVFAAGTPNEFKALNGLNLKLEDGEFVTIIGSNGAGKSTLFNAICGNFWLDKGHIILDGEDISYNPNIKEHAASDVFSGPDERNGTSSYNRRESCTCIFEK